MAVTRRGKDALNGDQERTSSRTVAIVEVSLPSQRVSAKARHSVREVKYPEHVDVRDMSAIYSDSGSEDDDKEYNEKEDWRCSTHLTTSSEADHSPVIADILNEPPKSNVIPKKTPNARERIEILSQAIIDAVERKSRALNRLEELLKNRIKIEKLPESDLKDMELQAVELEIEYVDEISTKAEKDFTTKSELLKSLCEIQATGEPNIRHEKVIEETDENYLFVKADATDP
ncbi:hypothetical protein BG011_002336, partial [Mortierella polycephala]